ncbi:MAG: tripartite tricarboxylate transporter TctB family protein [Firmicutes bacterium]|nr:tripartite tricarboxylate transporter TctB family protein [Bacillota bacterium]
MVYLNIKRDIIVNAVIFLVSIIFLLIIIPTQIRVEIGEHGVTATTFPKLASIIIILASLFEIIINWKGMDWIDLKKHQLKSGQIKDTLAVTGRPLVVIVATVIYAFVLIELLGFVTSTVFVMMCLMLFLDEKRLNIVVIVSLVLPLIINFAFSKLLYVRFPSGIMGLF